MVADLKALARLFISNNNEDREYLSVIEFSEDHGLNEAEADALDDLISQARITVTWDA